MKVSCYNTGVVKVGSDVVADKDTGLLHPGIIDSIASQVAAVRSQVNNIILVTSGAAAVGKKEIADMKIQVPDCPDYMLSQLRAAVGQPLLHSAYEAAFRNRGFCAPQMLLTQTDLRRKEVRDLFRLVLQIPRFVTIVNENDPVCVDEICGSDNDELAKSIAEIVRADFVAFLTNTKGVLADDGSTIPNIGADDALPSSVTSVSGGNGSKRAMRGKCECAQSLARQNILSFICYGRAPDALLRCINGNEDGTTFTRLRPVSAGLRTGSALRDTK